MATEQKSAAKTTTKAKTAARRAFEARAKNLVRVNLPEIGDSMGSDTLKVDQTVPIGINGEFEIVTRGPLAMVTPDQAVIMLQSKRFRGL